MGFDDEAVGGGSGVGSVAASKNVTLKSIYYFYSPDELEIAK